MFLTKINKLIWVIFLLPCIQSQVDEFTFSVSRAKTYYNITSHQMLINFICITEINGYIRFELLTIENQTDYTLIDKSIPYGTDKYDFSYNIVHTGSNDRHEVILRDLQYEKYEYICVTRAETYTIHLDVYYPPGPPICTNIVGNDSIITLMCESKTTDIPVNMTISDSGRIYTPHVESNNAYIAQITHIEGDIQKVTCNTTYTFIQSTINYPIKYSCIFNTTDMDITASHINSSTIAKYSMLTLIMAILLSGSI